MTTVSGGVVAVLVATAAFVSGGYTAQRMDLGDAAVWVANSASAYIGRANTEIASLNSVVAIEGSQTGIVQDGADVIAVDTADARADVIDAATSQVEKTVPLPPQLPRLFLSGDNVIVYSQGTGELWVMPFAVFSGFDAEQPATLNLGAGTIVSVDDSGRLFGYSRDTKQVTQVDVSGVGVVGSVEQSSLDTTTGTFSITSVGSHWVVLNQATAVLEIDGRIVDLTGVVDAGATLALQSPSSSGSSVLVGYPGGVMSVPAGGGSPTVLSSGSTGSPAAPLVANGCSYAAWSGGSAWRSCDGETTVPLTLASIASGARLVFQANGSRVVLNDDINGTAWAIQRDAQLIDNWSELIDENPENDPVEQNDDTSDTIVEKEQKPPVAVDDQFGARPGRATTLPVLLNDYDPNADVLVIDSVGDIGDSVGRVDLINERQQVQLTLSDSATGTVEIPYTISDGRGGTASATAVVTVKRDDQNSAPRQVRTTRATVEAGAQNSTQVLGDWVDPEGDPFYLSVASVALPDSVSSGPDGVVVFSADSASAGVVTVGLVVSDGTDEGTGSLSVTVAPVGKVPLIADPFVVLAYAGQEISIAPLSHVRGGSGVIALNAVPPRAGVTITPSYEAGTFRFESDQVRTHYLDYVVTDGNNATVTGTVRVDVQAPPDVNSTPIPLPKTAFVYTLRTSTVNIADTDIDPAGGVLLVTATSGVPPGSGVKAEIIDQKSVRVTLVGLLDGPVTFHYTVTNGLSDATGTITVIEIPLPTTVQPPVARDDVATARVGDAIVIDVLANDDQPDGLDIELDPRLVENLSGDAGLLFVSAGVLRYLAPDHPGNFTAVYQIIGPNKQTAQAQVRIEVREPNVETNNPPVAATVTGRVVAGQKVRIDIPLTGIDPDGDSVQLLGQETNPQKGAVSRVGSNFLEYEAGDYSAGTDSFTYTVVDALGARASGTVRVGIAPRVSGARDPVATADDVLARPGITVSVQVLANDSDPDGSALRVTGAVPNDLSTSAMVEDETIVTITPPSEEGNFSVAYTIENELGGTSTAYVTVTVSSDAPLSFPVANDTVLTLSDILNRTAIDVDVLKNVFFADGESSSLQLSVLPAFAASAQVTPSKRVRVTIRDHGQIIPFAVSHPDDPSITSYAFIWVPGFSDALPQLRTSTPAITVDSEAPLTIELNDYVIAVAGKRVQLTDSSTVQATHANGDSLVVDGDTLRFISAAHYSGPASISFEVTDGATPTDPTGRKAVLVLPITVTQRANQPPVFTGAVLEFEPSQQKQINLVRLTNYPHPDDTAQLSYSVLAPLPVGFSYQLSGQQLSIKADEDAIVGSTTSLTLAVGDSVGAGQSGRIELSVVSSTRPLARPAADSVVTERGETTVVDVLDNDEASNPFPDTPLRVVSITGIDGGSLPKGVSIETSNDDSELTVTVADSADPIDTNLQYQVADATDDPLRYTYGTVRISVQDVPDTPVAPVRQADSFVAGELKLRITPPQQNNSAIEGYSIVSGSHGDYRQDCGLTVICSLSGLTVGAEYRFSVVATNGIGDSEPSPVSDVYTIDYRPAAPTAVTAAPSVASVAPNGKSLTISWPTVPDPNPGTPVVGYTVLISGPGVSYSAVATSPFITTAGGALTNDASYTVSVYARNSAQVTSSDDWRRTSTTARTVGPPSVPKSGPKATINSDNSNGEIRVTWGDSNANGAGVVSYSVGRVTGSATAPECSTGSGKPNQVSADSVTSGWIDTAATDGETYTYIVYSDNGIYCTAAVTGALESKRPPGKPTAVVTVEYSGAGQFDLRAGALLAPGIAFRYEYRLNSGVWKPAVNGAWLTSSGDSSHYALATIVTFRACRDASSDYCGLESDPISATPLDVRATVTSCVADGVSLPLVSPPLNAGPVTVTYTLSYSQPVLSIDPLAPIVYAWSAYTYTDNDPVPSDAVGVRIKASVTVGSDPARDDPDYGERTCAPPGP